MFFEYSSQGRSALISSGIKRYTVIRDGLSYRLSSTKPNFKVLCLLVPRSMPYIAP